MDTALLHDIANALSIITVLSCLFLKVPQILYIREKQSVKGIFMQAILMEIFGFSVTTLYNYTNEYSLMTYLEYPIILLQVYVMMYYVLKFKGLLDHPVVLQAAVAYCSTVLLFMLNVLPKGILTLLIPFCTPLSGFAKVTYIYGIIKAGNADAISLTTWIISVLTNISRLFTVYVDSADTNLMINFMVSAMLSSGVLITALTYQKCKASRPRSRSRSESPAAHRKQH